MNAKSAPKIEVKVREKLGSRYAARARKEGLIPAVVYGHKRDAVAVTADGKALVEILHANAHLVDVVVDGKSEHCVVKDMQWDYLGDNIIHVDFERVDLSEKVAMEVDLELVGEPKALAQAGAFLDHPLTKLEISCRADSIPEKIVVDIAELDGEKAITVADIQLPAGIEATTDADSVVAQIKIAKEEIVEETSADEGAEPEVVGKDKEDAAE
ncbi:50S ribosomal protein L25 [Poriferisphaera corsica]|uniref:Large ribosomal subunit protein bL25 n=1 Tax=Poriferisphaera corsica TaxID=2528020 RepID=A0A517YTX5_9BACT|nr:50S ribosomal protein L25 [Poriferisphaera corsica]QDU33632.1 50S ribosomal protein L25 [Poriferisphaera corsica]